MDHESNTSLPFILLHNPTDNQRDMNPQEVYKTKAAHVVLLFIRLTRQ